MRQYSDAAHENLGLCVSTRNAVKRVDLGIIGLIPDLLISIWAADWQNNTAANLSDETRRSVSAGIVRRPTCSTLFSCLKMVISFHREPQLGSVEPMKSWAVCCDIWLLSPPLPPTAPSQPRPLCRQCSSRKKPAARMDTRLGSQRSRPSPACHSGHLHAGFKAAASVSSPPHWLPPAVFMFQLRPCVSFDGADGSRVIPTSIHLDVIRQGPARKDSWWPSGLGRCHPRLLPDAEIYGDSAPLKCYRPNFSPPSPDLSLTSL